MLIYDITNIITLTFIFSIVIYLIIALFKDFTRIKPIKVNDKLEYVEVNDKNKTKIFIYNSDKDFRKIKNIPEWLRNEILTMNLSDDILNKNNKNRIIAEHNGYVLYVENLNISKIKENEKEEKDKINRNIKYIIFNIDIADFIDYIISNITVIN